MGRSSARLWKKWAIFNTAVTFGWGCCDRQANFGAVVKECKQVVKAQDRSGLAGNRRHVNVVN